MKHKHLSYFLTAALLLSTTSANAQTSEEEPGDGGGIACAAVYEPVCGADGNTYSNSCYAEAYSVDIVAEGECQVIDDGGLFPGPDPVACGMDYNPVCGTDGITYPNKCVALESKADIDFIGECDSTCTDESCQTDGGVEFPIAECGNGSTHPIFPWEGEIPVLYSSFCKSSDATSKKCFVSMSDTGSGGSGLESAELDRTAEDTTLIGSYNMVVASYIFLEVQSTSNKSVEVTALVLDKDGKLIGSKRVTIPAYGRRDVDLHSLADGSFGSVRVVHNATLSDIKATISQYKANDKGELIPLNSQALTSK